MSKKYTIERIEDILSIPEDRRDQFFIELKSFIEKTDNIIKGLKEEGIFGIKNLKMEWCDDGVDVIKTVALTMPNKEVLVVPFEEKPAVKNFIVMFQNTCGADDDYGKTWARTFSSRGEAIFWLEDNGYKKANENYYTRWGGFHDETDATLPGTSY